MRVLAIDSRNRLRIAGIVGLLVSVVAAVRISVPTWSLLAQFFQFSPFARIVILTKLLSPILSFLLMSGWVWVLFWIGEGTFSSRRGKATSNTVKLFQGQIHSDLNNPSREMEISQDFITPQSILRNNERTRLAVPPLFQLSPETLSQLDQLPKTPFLTNSEWEDVYPMSEETKVTDEEQHDGEEGDEANSRTQAEAIVESQEVYAMRKPQDALEKISSLGDAAGTFSLRNSVPTETQKPVTLTLLKQVRASVRADDGTTREVKLRGGENAIRLIQLAYIAWQQGKHVDRDKMLTYVLSRGKRRDMTTDQLGEVFDAAKRYLRQDLDRVVHELESEGHPVSQEIDFFSNEPGFYWLHSSCRISDLEKIEEHYRVIQRARKEGLLDERLDGTVPEWVLEACEELIEAYPGDFLQGLTEKFPGEFGPWVKEPITLYRDRYLAALLIMASYESALGKNFFDEKLSAEQNEEQRRNHIGRAAQLFYDYAMYALNSRWDQKLKFAYRADKDGERVVRSARAMRRCVVELGKLGNPDMIDQIYLTFKERMNLLSEGNWKPDPDTERDVEDAKKTTSAYRFASQISAAHKDGDKK